ncbi:MAG: serine hydrolase [Marinilabiliales bacterium]
MRKFWIFLIITAILGSCTLTKTLYYNTVNIDDYKIFHNREVKTTDSYKWKLSDSYNKYTIPNEKLSYFNEIGTVAYLVVKDGKIYHEEYWDNYNSDSYSNSFSMAKSFVSLLIGFAIDDGYIKSVNQKVADFLPEFGGDERKEITIKDVLTMSSGLDWGESYWNPFGRTARAYYGKNLYKIITNLKLKNKPGERFAYSSGDTQILAFIIEKATGKTLSDYCSEKLWKPLGAKHDALWSLDKKNGHEKAYCCFNSNARDFALIGQFILQNGNWKGKQLISKDYLDESFTPASHLVYGEENKKVTFYGYQWWLMDYKGMKIKYARGLLGQYIIVIPEKEMVIVRLGHHRDKKTEKGLPKDLFVWIDVAMDITEN